MNDTFDLFSLLSHPSEMQTLIEGVSINDMCISKEEMLQTIKSHEGFVYRKLIDLQLVEVLFLYNIPFGVLYRVLKIRNFSYIRKS